MNSPKHVSDRDETAEKDPLMEITIRRLSTPEEYRACVALQNDIWGGPFTETVPPAILMIGQKIGGVTAGAFDANGNLQGFVFGLTGMKDGRLVHWSHMLGVREGLRDHGLGRRLKYFQRNLVREMGVEIIYWTIEPLEARNAHLNLNRLGTRVTEYVPDMYGGDIGSDLQRGIGVDRFIVAWHIGEKDDQDALPEHVERDTSAFGQAPVVNTNLAEGGVPVPIACALQAVPMVRIEIPVQILAVQKASLELAGRWRASTREAFLWYQEHGYQVAAFYRDPESGRCFYVLTAGEKG